MSQIMDRSRIKKSIFVFMCLVLAYLYAQPSLFSDLNDTLNPCIFSTSIGTEYKNQIWYPSFNIETTVDSISSAFSVSVDTNSIYLNRLQGKLEKEKRNYSEINDFIFRYEKINGVFFTLVSLVAENDFLLAHPDLDVNVERKLFTNNMYIDLIRNSIEDYSGVKISDSLISEYVSLLNEYDYSIIEVNDIYKIGLMKSVEKGLNTEIIDYNSKTKRYYGFLPVFSFQMNYSKAYDKDMNQDFMATCNCNVGISIPNIGFTGSVTPVNNNNSVGINWSIGFRFPIEKQNANNIMTNEYSFSSESFLIELSSMLFSYNQLVYLKMK